MKKFLMIIIVMFCIVTFSNAKDYNTGIGLRGSFSNGLTIKHFLGEKGAIEGLLTSRWKGLIITGLYEIHNQAFGVDRLNWYFGFGGHIGFWDGHHVKWAKDNRSYTVIGIDGILGMEYNFNEIPINLSIDWKPVFNIIGHSGFWGNSGGISIRYIF